MRFLGLLLILSLLACKTKLVEDASDLEGSDAPTRNYEMAGGYRVVPGFECDGFPRLWIETAPGYCVGLVLAFSGSDRGLMQPRGIANIPGTDDFIVADRVSKSTLPINRGVGKLFRLTKTPSGYKLIEIMKGLSNVHKVLFRPGDDRRAYIGVDHGIFRFDINRPENIEWVIENLPSQFISPAQQIPGYHLDAFLHALTNFAFDSSGNLFVNVGSPDDSCSGHAQRKCGLDDNFAHVRKYNYNPNTDQWDDQYAVFARGLRNSLALAVHWTGTVLQGENSIDLKGLHEPFEELNALESGGHYGWPYCINFWDRAPEFNQYGGFRCDSSNPEYRPPYVLLPGHSAPLDMMYYPKIAGGMFPELTGKLLIALHGYRETGHRIIVADTDNRGLPVLAADSKTATFFTDKAGPGGRGIISGREPVKYSSKVNSLPRAIEFGEIVGSMYGVGGYRPNGSPAVLAFDAKGAIWFTDDAGFHSSETGIFRIAKSTVPLPPFGADPEINIEKSGHLAALAENPKLLTDFVKIKQQLIIPYCQTCHGEWRDTQDVADNSDELFKYVFDLGFVNLSQPTESKAISRISGVVTPAMPPTIFDPTQRANLLKLAQDLIIPWATEVGKSFNRVYIVKAGTLTVRKALNPVDVSSSRALEDFAKCNISLTAGDTVYAKSVVAIQGYEVAQFSLAGALKSKIEKACGSTFFVAAVRADSGKVYMEKMP